MIDTPEIREAVRIEFEVPESLWPLYLECMNGTPMSERVTEQELRDGCILTYQVYLHCLSGLND